MMYWYALTIHKVEEEGWHNAGNCSVSRQCGLSQYWLIKFLDKEARLTAIPIGAGAGPVEAGQAEAVQKPAGNAI